MDDPRERLRRFSETVDALSANGSYPDCLDGILNLGLEIKDGRTMLTAKMTKVNNDLLRSYLVTFRRFTLKKDPCFLPKVLRAAEVVLRGTRSESRIKKAKVRITCHRNEGYPTAFHGDWPSTKPEEIFNIWIYGRPDGFHYDPGSQYAKAWDELGRIPSGREHVAGKVLQYVRAIDREVRHIQKLVVPYISK